MTKEELLAPFEDIHLQYQYKPVHSNSMHPIVYDEPCTSNVIGKDDESVLELLCYDA